MFTMSNFVGNFIWLSCLFVLVHCQGQRSAKNYGHSKLVLFRGKERHAIDGKSCTVGVAFAKSERFSCACVNGIWAFYTDPCSAPLAMIGGNNFCFRMPNIAIRHVTTVSSPMRALSNSLTVFERNMESVKTKVFRNVHMQLDGTTDFVTMNSSWTLLSTDGNDGICLNSKDEKLDDFVMEGTTKKPEGIFCTFRNVNQKMPEIGAILKGCNGSYMSLEPTDCQPILPGNSEAFCASLPVLEAFETQSEGDNNDLELFRAARSNLQNWGYTTTTTTTTTTRPTTTTTTTRYPPGYSKAPGWLQREIRQMVGAKNYTGYEKMAGRSVKSNSGIEHKSDSEILKMIKKEWENPMDFTLPPPSHSDSIITDQLWKYQRKIIREQLKIKTPDDMTINDGNSSSKASQLLFITRDVMKIICPLQKPEYFDMITEVFLQIQKKIFRWKEPYVKTLDFKRIEAALTACRESAVPLVKPSGNSCSAVTDDLSPLPATIPMPEVLKSDGYEPIIESVWKILVSAHSYCYKNFDQFFNDHHKFTTIMFPFFTNEIHQHWFRKGLNKTEENEYAGIIGPVAKIISNIDECTFAARTKSSYPFHLTRPTQLVKYDLELKHNLTRTLAEAESGTDEFQETQDSTEVIGQLERVRRDIKSGTKGVVPKKTPNRKREVKSVEKDPWKMERRVMGGLGFCLKKYNEPKKHLGYNCDS